MVIVNHLWQLILFGVIVAGPFPFSCLLTQLNQRENDQCSWSHLLLILGAGWSLIQVCLGLLLGSLEVLKLPTVILSEILLFLAGSIVIIREKSFPFTFPKIHPSLKKTELFIIASLAFVGLILLEQIATNPITNYDSLWFHLPAIVRWYQTGSLTLLDSANHWIFDHEQARIYPYNLHLLCLLSILPFQEDFLVALPLLLCWAILGLTVYLLSQQFGATRFYALAFSGLTLTVPMVINQVNTIHIDLPLAAFFGVSLYFALSYHQSRALSELSLFLGSLGMLAGIKVTGLIYGAFIISLLCLLELKKTPDQHLKSFQLKTLKKPILIFGITSLLLLGGFWYVRNLLHINYPIPVTLQQPSPVPKKSSNPIPPQTSSTPSLPPPSEPFNAWQSTLLAQFRPFKLEHWKLVGMQVFVRLQIPFIIMLILGLAAPILLIKKHKLTLDKPSLVLVSLLLGTGFLYAITPYSSGTAGEAAGYLSPIFGFNLRYGFPFLCILGTASAVLAKELKVSQVILTILVLISSLLGIVSSTIFDRIRNSSFTGKNIVWGSQLIDQFKSSPLVASRQAMNLLESHLMMIGMYCILYLGLMLILSWFLFKRHPTSQVLSNTFTKIKQFSRAGFISLTLILILSATWIARENRDLNRQEIYQGIYNVIEENTVPGESIAFFLSRRSYLFYGKDYTRDVLYIPLETNPVSLSLDPLQKHHVNVIAMGPLTPINRETRQGLLQLTKPNGNLQQIFGENFDQEPVLYRLKPQ